MTRNWLAVASAEHVEIGLTEGFMQVSHGKASPLRRIQPGDRVGRKPKPMSAWQGTPYQADMGFGFRPYRRDVAWHEAEPTPLAALKDALAFTQDKNWGYRLRQGVVEISDADMTTIADAMFKASAPPRRLAA